MKEPMKCEREVEQNGAGDIELCGGELEEKGTFNVMGVASGMQRNLYQCKSCKDVTIK